MPLSWVREAQKERVIAPAQRLRAWHRLRIKQRDGSVTACRAVGAERRKRPPTDIQSGVDLVSLDVCVREPSGGFMADLAADDFLVLESGKPQRILFVVPSDAARFSTRGLMGFIASLLGPMILLRSLGVGFRFRSQAPSRATTDHSRDRILFTVRLKLFL